MHVVDSPVPFSDPSFIGCWWMPYLIYGVLLIVASIPLLFFPKHMPHYYEQKRARYKFHQDMISMDSIRTAKATTKQFSAKILHFSERNHKTRKQSHLTGRVENQPKHSQRI